MAAIDDTLTIAPPLPPWRVDMRFTASRAHRKLPVTLIASMRWMRSADIASTRELRSTMPALFTSTVEPAELLVHHLEHAKDIRFARDVSLHRNGLVSQLTDQLRGGVARSAR